MLNAFRKNAHNADHLLLAEENIIDKRSLKSCEKAAKYFADLGNLKKAVIILEKAADYCRDSANTAGEIDYCGLISEIAESPAVKYKFFMRLGELCSHAGNYSFSETAFTSAYKIAKKNRNETHKITALLKLANMYYKMGNYAGSSETFRKAKRYTNKLGNHGILSMISSGIGINYRIRKKYYMASKYFQKELVDAKKSDNPELLYKAYENLGISYNHQGKGDKAFAFFQKALQIAKEICNKNSISNCYINIGKAYFTENDYGSALNSFEMAYRLSTKARNSTNKSLALSNIASVHFAEGRYVLAKKDYNKLQIQYIKQKDVAGLAFVHGAMGNLCIKTRNYKAAITHYLTSIRFYKEIQKLNSISLLLGNIGLAYRYLKKYSRAEYYLEQQLKIERKNQNYEGVVRSLINLGTVYSRTQRHRKALRNYSKVISICQKISLKQYLAAAYLNAAEILLMHKKIKKAKEYGVKSFELAKINNDISNMEECKKIFSKLNIKYNATTQRIVNL